MGTEEFSPVLTVGIFFTFSTDGYDSAITWQIADLKEDNFIIQKWHGKRPMYYPFRIGMESLQKRFDEGEFRIIFPSITIGI